MSKIHLKGMLFLGFFIALTSLPALAEPTEATLIEAWETIQRNDPETVVFEKLGENLYKFKTERFPFDGKLKILNVSVDDRMKDYEYGNIMGIIEVELVDLPADFSLKYSYSYSMWGQNNMLYYDEETDGWLTSNEYYAKTQEKLPKTPSLFFLNILSYGPILILIVFIVFSLIVIANLQRKNKQYMDHALELTEKSIELVRKSLDLGEDSNKTLKEILEELKK
ncbi:hypothetical protein KAW18_07500 [candidate division WOR-3 bacterium]|nr:hypothetical protein [candidate division WOR-3 bacterium]MCK4527202.1 hypothetical protein [candidate division WOR-3 bacterium]